MTQGRRDLFPALAKSFGAAPRDQEAATNPRLIVVKSVLRLRAPSPSKC